MLDGCPDDLVALFLEYFEHKDWPVGGSAKDDATNVGQHGFVATSAIHMPLSIGTWTS